MAFLTGDQVDALAHQVDDRYRTLIDLLAYGRLRWGEAAALRTGRLDLARRRIEVAESLAEIGGTLSFGPTKNYRSRTIGVPAFLADMLTDTSTTTPVPARRARLHRQRCTPSATPTSGATSGSPPSTPQAARPAPHPRPPPRRRPPHPRGHPTKAINDTSATPPSSSPWTPTATCFLERPKPPHNAAYRDRPTDKAPGPRRRWWRGDNRRPL
jgi:hypothetical protein